MIQILVLFSLLVRLAFSNLSKIVAGNETACLRALPDSKILILQDATATSEDAQDQFQSQIAWLQLAVTSLGAPFEIGVASFTDRPYVGTRAVSRGDHCFRFSSRFASTLKPQDTPSLTIDPIFSEERFGGHLDALYTAARLKAWETHSGTTLAPSEDRSVAKPKNGEAPTTPKRYVVVFTSTSYRPHGQIDGVLNMTQPRIFPAGCALNDYPSIDLLKRAMAAFDVDPVFVVPKGLVKTYEKLCEDLGKGEVVVSHVDHSNGGYKSQQEGGAALFELLSEEVILAMEELCQNTGATNKAPTTFNLDGTDTCNSQCASKPEGEERLKCIAECGTSVIKPSSDHKGEIIIRNNLKPGSLRGAKTSSLKKITITV